MQEEKQILRFQYQLTLNRLFLYLLLLFGWFASNGQGSPCDIIFKGVVYDQASSLPLPNVNVYIQDIQKGEVSNTLGEFEITNLCPGEYHVAVSHIGCQTKEYHIQLSKDTSIQFYLEHSNVFLENVEIHSTRSARNQQTYSSVERQKIEDNSNKNLATLLENELGVSTIKSGSGIAKPVVHGMYGNRLLLINNGVIQGGQQWGNDHSPEIDPLSADKITVVKGTNALEYAGNNLGSVILIEPKPIGRDPHIHGNVNYSFESNGRGHNLHGGIQKYSPIVSWRINGTFRKYGDRKSPSYFLTNTGSEEASGSISLEKSWQEKFFMNLYASTYNSNLGILRGAHIGNLTDLEEAINRDVPFYTNDTFSYAIQAPFQQVNHHLVKLSSSYYFNESRWLELTLSGQQNNRKEFDVRRSGKSDIPALFLEKYTSILDISYSQEGSKYKGKIGTQTIYVNNTNNPNTGILPLIPDYLSWANGLYVIYSKTKNKFTFKAGGRFDYQYQNVAAIEQTPLITIQKYTNHFRNFGSNFGVSYKLGPKQTISANTGFASRSPGINELYSNGLHQGVSGIEIGDKELRPEEAIKTTLSYQLVTSEVFSIQALVYHQLFFNYIFLQPTDETRLTIRGAFPVFRYRQTPASISGLDISTQLVLNNSFLIQANASLLKGTDTDDDIPLVYMPSNNFLTHFIYRHQKEISLSSLRFEQLEIGISHRLVLQQTNLLPNQDFLEAPSTYYLLGIKISSTTYISKQKFRWHIEVDNALNTQYRDYLNRLRYFADDTGISVTAGISYKF